MNIVIIPILPIKYTELPTKFKVEHDLYDLKITIERYPNNIRVKIVYNGIAYMDNIVSDNVTMYHRIREDIIGTIKYLWSNGRDLQHLRELFTIDSDDINTSCKYDIFKCDGMIFMNIERLHEYLRENYILDGFTRMENLCDSNVTQLALSLNRVFAHALFNSLDIVV